MKDKNNIDMVKKLYDVRNKMADLVADNVLDVLQGNPPRCIVPSWGK